MNLNHYVIHELDKETNSTTALTLSDALPDHSDPSNRLIDTLHDRYKERETYGRFDPSNVGTFQEQLASYRSEGYSSNSFLNFSRNVMQALREQIQNVTLATGGYFVFADYSTSHGNYLSIFLVRNTEGFKFNKNAGLAFFNVEPEHHIGVDKFAMGCKINKDKYGLTDGNCLSFIRTDRQGTSGYFVNWISATELKQNSEYTNKLCDIIKQIDLSVIDGVELPRDEFQKRVYEYCSSTPDGRVSLLELSTRIYGEDNERKIIDYAHDNNIELDSEFRPDKVKLKRLYRIDVSADNIQLKFDYSAFQSRVRVEENRVIIDSQSLAWKIRQETANLNG